MIHDLKITVQLSVTYPTIWGAIAVGALCIAAAAIVVITAPVSIPALAVGFGCSAATAATVVYGTGALAAGAGVITTVYALNN